MLNSPNRVIALTGISDALTKMPKKISQAKDNGSHTHEIWMLLTQAGICCDEARQAAKRYRYRATCGLLATAILLYKTLLRLEVVLKDSALQSQIKEQIQHVESEKAVYAKLCDQWRQGRTT